MTSPYAELPVEKWGPKTKQLIRQHPLGVEAIEKVAMTSWDTLWSTKIGRGKTAIRLDQMDVPATVAGYFFEKLFVRELQSRFPVEWRGAKSKDEKDIVYMPDSRFSIEMKTSGQLGTKVYGNRSYGQKPADTSIISKAEKSGYYITANFYKKTLILLRFGWIDASDWKPQASPTGQAASLPNEVYQHKLVEIAGAYRLNAPVALIEGVGPKTAQVFASENITTIYELLNHTGDNPLLQKFCEKVKAKGY